MNYLSNYDTLFHIRQQWELFFSSSFLIRDDMYEHVGESADHVPADDVVDLVHHTLRLGIDLRSDPDIGLNGVVFLTCALSPSSSSSPMTPTLASWLSCPSLPVAWRCYHLSV